MAVVYQKGMHNHSSLVYLYVWGEGREWGKVQRAVRCAVDQCSSIALSNVLTDSAAVKRFQKCATQAVKLLLRRWYVDARALKVMQWNCRARPLPTKEFVHPEMCLGRRTSTELKETNKNNASASEEDRGEFKRKIAAIVHLYNDVFDRHFDSFRS